MTIGSECFANLTLLHHDEGNAIGEGPFFVGSLAVELKTGSIELVVTAYHFHGLILKHAFDEASDRCSNRRHAETVCNFVQNPSGGRYFRG